MMMYGMGQGLIWGLILSVFLLFGFAYIVWILANKESGSVKVIGQIIAAVIALIALVILIYGSIFGGSMQRRAGYWGPMGPGMMQQPGAVNQYMYRQMMNDPAFRQQMMQQLRQERMTK